jgi:internalin A
MHLVGLTGLRELGLSFAMVTDAGLEQLKGLKALRWLDVQDTRVTDGGVEQLKKSLPNVKVTR